MELIRDLLRKFEGDGGCHGPNSTVGGWLPEERNLTMFLEELVQITENYSKLPKRLSNIPRIIKHWK